MFTVISFRVDYIIFSRKLKVDPVATLGDDVPSLDDQLLMRFKALVHMFKKSMEPGANSHTLPEKKFEKEIDDTIKKLVCFSFNNI